jgi:hypothetical protein
MRKDLTDDEIEMANLMSEISENAYAAGWLMNLEHIVWQAVISGPRRFGRVEITKSDIEKLTRLSGATQTWIVYNDQETAIPIDEWKAIFTKDILEDPSKLNW